MDRLARNLDDLRRIVHALSSRIAEGISKAKVAREFGISRQTLYQYLQGGDDVS